MQEPAEAEAAASKPTATLRDALLVCTIYLFFVGFVYRHFLFVRLGIPDVDSPPLNTYLVLAFEPLTILWRQIATVLIVGSVTFYWVKYFRRNARFEMPTPLLITFAVLAFPALWTVAYAAAVYEANAIIWDEVTPNDPGVTITFQPGKAQTYDPAFAQAAAGGNVSMLSRNDTTYFVLDRGTIGEKSHVYGVPRADVAHLSLDLEAKDVWGNLTYPPGPGAR